MSVLKLRYGSKGEVIGVQHEAQVGKRRGGVGDSRVEEPKARIIFDPKTKTARKWDPKDLKCKRDSRDMAEEYKKR